MQSTEVGFSRDVWDIYPAERLSVPSSKDQSVFLMYYGYIQIRPCAVRNTVSVGAACIVLNGQSYVMFHKTF